MKSVFALKVAFVVCEFGSVFVLLDIFRSTGRGSHLVLAFAWNPLLAIEVAGSGHVDIVGALLLAVSAAALLRRWRAAAAVALGLAIAVKFLPIVLLPIYWKRVRMREAALGAAVVGFLYVPFLNRSFLNRSFFNAGRIPLGSLETYVHSFRFNAPVFAALEQVASPELLAGLAVLAGFLTAIWVRRRAESFSPDAFAWPMAASLLCAPVVYPWYLLWLLPFVWTASTVPLDRLDGEHHSRLLRLAFARAWSPVDASGVDYDSWNTDWWRSPLPLSRFATSNLAQPRGRGTRCNGQMHLYPKSFIIIQQTIRSIHRERTP